MNALTPILDLKQGMPKPLSNAIAKKTTIESILASLLGIPMY